MLMCLGSLTCQDKHQIFGPGINMHLLRSDHKWTALSTGVNAPKTHWGRIEIRPFKPHSEVVWTTCGHIISAVCTHLSWATLRIAYSTDILLVSGSTYTVQRHKQQQQQATRTKTTSSSRGWKHTRHAVWFLFGLKSQYNRNWMIHDATCDLWGHLEKDGGEELQSIMAATQTENQTPQECFRKAKDSNNRSGRDRISWPFYEKLDRVLWDQPSVCPGEGDALDPEVESPFNY